MNKENLLELSEIISQIALKASEGIMDIYLGKEITQKKKKDGSPLTEADLTSHKIIIEGLSNLNLNFPVLSEEGEVRHKMNSDTFWLIDPLDGTKEFLERNGEFTVNIALIENGKPKLGVVSVPAKDELFRGIPGVGAYKEISGNLEKIKTRKLKLEKITVTVSRSHQTVKDHQFLEEVKKNFKEIEIIQTGSSLKLCRVAEGKADVYCRMGPTFQWDIASGQAILEAAGGSLKGLDGESLRYILDSEKKNPKFYCVGDLNFPWKNLFLNSFT